MKHIITLLIFISCIISVKAQQHIQRSTSTFRNRPEVEGTINSETYSDKDVKRNARYEVFSFTMPKGRKELLKLVEDAFVMDMETAYASAQGVSGIPRYYNPNGSYSVCALYVDENNSIPIGLKKGNNYYYACFIDPEDSTRTHRYAYFLEYGIKGNEIVGRVGVTYATTAQYRQSVKSYTVKQKSNGGSKVTISSTTGTDTMDDLQLAIQMLESFSADDQAKPETAPEEQWLAEFALKVKWLRQNWNDDTATQYAASIYGLCKRSQCLDETERKLATSELNKLLKMVKDDTVITLLKASIERLDTSHGSKDGSCNDSISNSMMYFLS